MKKLVSIIASVVLISIFMLNGCATLEENKSPLDSGWKIEKYRLGAEDYLHSSYVSLSRNSLAVKDVWFNISATEVEDLYADVYIYNGGDNPSSNYKHDVHVTADQVKKATDGWIKVVINQSVELSTVKIVTAGGYTLNEVIFINEDNEVVKATFSKADTMYKDKYGNPKGANNIYKSDLEKLNLGEFSPLNILDEQDSFDTKAKY